MLIFEEEPEALPTEPEPDYNLPLDGDDPLFVEEPKTLLLDANVAAEPLLLRPLCSATSEPSAEEVVIGHQNQQRSGEGGVKIVATVVQTEDTRSIPPPAPLPLLPPNLLLKKSLKSSSVSPSSSKENSPNSVWIF